MIPDYTIEGLKRYIVHHLRTGSFLQAVLSGELERASYMADQNNRQCLKEIVDYIETNLPKDSFGSPQKVEKWVNQEAK